MLIVLSQQQKQMFVSDGENKLKTSVQKLKLTPIGYDILFGETNKMIGVVSVSDVLTVKIPKL